MKQMLRVIALLTILLSISCKPKEQGSQEQSAPQTRRAQSHGDEVAVRSGVVQEVIQTSAYTYLSIKEQDTVSWIAVTKREMEPGAKVFFSGGLEMRDFTSKELQRTFETIYFVNKISTEAPSGAGAKSPTMPHQGRAPVEKAEVSVEPAEGGITIGTLFAGRASYAGKTVRIRGRVTKINRAIMGKNWVHLQDGTGDDGNYDLTITTQDAPNVGDVVTFEGAIVLDKDFGSGYAYDLLMEQAKIASP